MRFSISLILAVVAMNCCFYQTDALCGIGKSPGIINVCKAANQGNCIGTSSGNTCINLIGGPFVSGSSSGAYSCTVWRSTGCSGDSLVISRKGRNFGWQAKSYKCPCS